MSSDASQHPHDESSKAKLKARLRRARGQLDAIERMVDEDSYCVDVMTQIAAVQGALGKVGQLLLSQHLAHCVTAAFNSGDDAARQEKIDELVGLFGRYGMTKGKGTS